jgi:hypothetical protein
MADPLDLSNYSDRLRAFGGEPPPEPAAVPVSAWEFGVLSAALLVLGGGIGAVIARLMGR